VSVIASLQNTRSVLYCRSTATKKEKKKEKENLNQYIATHPTVNK